MANKLESMESFFRDRADGYDDHMKNDVVGAKEGYAMVARLLPPSFVSLLDLGCGTGLELEHVYARHPAARVTAVDLSADMLARFMAKYEKYSPRVIQGSYFDVELGKNAFDAAISFETMHHFERAQKVSLYRRIYQALKSGGAYVECDYMVLMPQDEANYLAEYRRLRDEQGIAPGELYHIDIPFTVAHQIEMLEEAGFSLVEMSWRMGDTTIIKARKE